MSDQKVLGLQFKHWCIVFLVYSAILIVFQLGSIFSTYWISQKGTIGLEDVEWYGALSTVIEGDGLYDEEFYSDLEETYCDDDGEDRIRLWQPKKQRSDFDKAACRLFEDLSGASSIFLILEIPCIIVIASLMCVMCCALNNVFKCMCCGMCTAIAAPILHIAAFIFWIGGADANFNDNCDKIRDGKDRTPVCGGTGPILALVIIILVVIWSVLFCVFFFYSESV